MTNNTNLEQLNDKKAKEDKIKYSPEYIYNVYINKIKPRLGEIQLMLFAGYSFFQIAKELGVSNSLLWHMRVNRKCDELRDVFRTDQLQIENVENALYRKCVGYTVYEQQAIKVKHEYYNKKGKKCVDEQIKLVDVAKHVEPDFQAIRFYLLNNKPKSYHAESQPPRDEAVQNAIANVKEVIVKIKEAANNDPNANDD